MWILTRQINAYDQDGEYFVKAFEIKPTVEQIMHHANCNLEYAIHILDVGGRLDIEYEWFYLVEE